MRSSNPTNYNFTDLTGKTLAGALVLHRAPNVNGNSRWHCKLACGHQNIIQGIHLRASDKAGVIKKCRACRGLK
jgi:hypothetical protein